MVVVETSVGAQISGSTTLKRILRGNPLPESSMYCGERPRQRHYVTYDVPFLEGSMSGTATPFLCRSYCKYSYHSTMACIEG